VTGDFKIITVDSGNVSQHRFFCYKSKPKTEGFRRKSEWLAERFAEGLRLKIVYEGKRSVGFIEYLPGEVGWRAVRAQGYMLIHCLWVVGSGKGKGYGSRLVQECIEEARDLGVFGVSMVTSSDHWLAGDDILLRNGFQVVDQAPPSFGLLVHRFDDAPLPSFPDDWEARRRRYGQGLTVVRTDQCPYVDMVTETVLTTAEDMGIPGRVVELGSTEEVQEAAPSAYGVFNVVCNGELVTYHWLGDKDLRRRLEQCASR
jgi:GNAT superfamily N-acetyltransferase